MNAYDFQLPSLAGATVDLGRFRGEAALIVNVASRCGFTPQYAALEALYQRYRARGFTVLGFPCNQFGRQEPGSAAAIAEFCALNYGVSFPMFAKIDVNGPHAHPLYAYLKAAAPGLLGSRAVKWNFTKFLIDRTGRCVARHAPATDPARLWPAVEGLLGATGS